MLTELISTLVFSFVLFADNPSRASIYLYVIKSELGIAVLQVGWTAIALCYSTVM